MKSFMKNLVAAIDAMLMVIGVFGFYLALFVFLCKLFA